MHGSSYFIRESITVDTEFAMCDANANANYNSMSSSSEFAWLEDEPLVEDSTMSWHMLYFMGVNFLYAFVRHLICMDKFICIDNFFSCMDILYFCV